MIKDTPIWITDWVIGYTGGRGKQVDHYTVKGVITKGKDEGEILESKDSLRKVLWMHEQNKKATKVSKDRIDEVTDKYIAIRVQLIKQVGYGVAE